VRRLVAACVAAVLLAGCSAVTAPAPDVLVTGDPGSRPTLTYVTPLAVSKAVHQVVWQGTGDQLVDGEPVLVDFWLEDASNATVVKESYLSSPTPRPLTVEDLGKDLYDTLHRQRVGARLLQISPAPGSGAANYPTVTVLDVLATRAAGDPVAPREGLPTVTLGGDGSPSITASTAAPPTDLVTQPLVRGAGAQVADGDTVTVQYTGFAWATGAPFESTWTNRSPVSFDLAMVPAWASLVEQPVGSQVMLVVPPTYPLGATQSEELKGQTIVFVIDILATGPAPVTG